MREKLYELLHRNVCECPNCAECKYCDDEDGCISYMEHRMADLLVENGVTIPVCCKDCKYGELDFTEYNQWYLCHYEGGIWNRGDHFCSYGERKDNEKL